MTRIFILFITILFSTTSFGQDRNCFSDTTSTSGKILQKFVTYSITGASITIKKTGKKFQSYRFCEYRHLPIDSLNEILTDSQIDSLFNCDNGALKAIAFILFAKRNNNKEIILRKLNEILNQEYIFMAGSCTDAVELTNLGRLNYQLLIIPNLLFKPNFKLTRKDKKIMELKLANYDKLFSAN